jgi:hypothetical protein
MKHTLKINTRARQWKLEFDEEAGIVTVLECVDHSRSLMERAAAWAKAEASQVISGPLSDEQYEARVAVCRSCDQLDPADAPQIGHCKACGCGKRPRAEITVKGRMPAATCPKNKWAAL